MADELGTKFFSIFVDVGWQIESDHYPDLVRDQNNIAVLSVSIKKGIKKIACPKYSVLADYSLFIQTSISVTEDWLLAPCKLSVHPSN